MPDGRRRRWWADPVTALALVIAGLLGLVLFLPDSGPAPVDASTRGGPAAVGTVQEVLPSGPPIAPRAGTLTTRSGATATGGRARPATGRRANTCVAAGPRIAVATFNIHSGFNRAHNRVEIDRIADEIAALQADVVLLQEVDRNRAWNGRIDEPGILAERLSMYYAFAPNVVRPGDSQYGTAVLSKFPIVDLDNTLLPRFPDAQQRGLLRVRIQPYGTTVDVYNTHLEASSAANRLAQARVIRDLLASSTVPTILGGDLNAYPGTDVMATLRTVLSDSWERVGAGAGYTHPAWSPRGRIDYLLYRGDVTPLDSVVVPGAVSDHAAVRGLFQIGSQTAVCLPNLG
ncbi:hypothetical protein GCM10022215_10590 [Nocardioides fonticola]|uniref:Endonuclease/exonuclease/phosphatase domain-containing protein n=1 Tax=Nocardioides fonticola TaxID=450363 RepID=A0ABP7XEW7_9ACTN